MNPQVSITEDTPKIKGTREWIMLTPRSTRQGAHQAQLGAQSQQA